MPGSLKSTPEVLIMPLGMVGSKKGAARVGKAPPREGTCRKTLVSQVKFDPPSRGGFVIAAIVASSFHPFCVP